MSAALLVWARVALTYCQTPGATPAFCRSACYVTASKAKQQKSVTNQLTWCQARVSRHSYSTQAGSSRQSAARSYLGYTLGSAAALGALGVYLGNKAGELQFLFEL